MFHILIVEDDKILQEMYNKLLTNHGYHVKTAINGEEGLKLALEDHPELILLDIRMPKMDGLTMLHSLRSDPWGKDAAVIILTNLEPNDQRLSQVMTDKPSYYLIKANNQPDQVLEKIQTVLGEIKERTNGQDINS